MCKESKANEISSSEENYLIQKANPLFSLWKSKLTLREYKLLDIFLGKINSKDENVRTVELNKGEVERLYGVTVIHKKELDDCLSHLMETIEIDDENEPNGFVKINLFTLAACRKINGEWNVILSCSPEAKKYFFNIENIGYFKYRLKNVRKIKGLHTYHLYMYVEKHRPQKKNISLKWTIGVDELREIMHCTEKTYDEFKRFNNLKLTPAVNAINANTDTKFEIKLIKSGKRVIKIEFTLKPNVIDMEIQNQSNQNENIKDVKRISPLIEDLDDIDEFFK